MPYTYDPDALGVVPEGVQMLTVTEIKETESNKGDPMWIVRMEDKDGYELTEFIVHKPNIIDWKFRPLWEAAGLEWPTGRAVLDEAKLVGRRVLVTVKHEKSQQFGLQARAEGYAPLGADDGTQSAQGAMEFETAPPKPANAVYGDDDDIPFG